MKNRLLQLTVIITLFAVSVSAQDKLSQIQNAIHEKGANWIAGENWVSRLSESDFTRLLGAERNNRQLFKAAEIVLPKAAYLPGHLDWRNNDGNWVTSVKQQGKCGSCWSFSATGQVESWWKIFNLKPDSSIDLSEQFLISSGKAGNCKGGNVGAALTYYKKHGIPLESYMPYQATDTLSCDAATAGWESSVVKIPGWGYITQAAGLVDNIKNALMFHPLSVTYTVYEDFSSYTSGVYEHVSGKEKGGHAVLLVGWNDADSCWICKNSWGGNWGENGYFRIKWGQCGIDSDVLFIYDHLMGNTKIQFSESSLSVELQQGAAKRSSVEVINPNADIFEFSAIGLQTAFHSDQFNAWKGKSIWCGDPVKKGYGNHWLQYLDTPVIDLGATASPLLTFKGLWNIEDPAGSEAPWDGWDGWNVWISTDGGSSFNIIQPLFPLYNCQSLWSFGDSDQGWNMGQGIVGWGGKTGGWIDVTFDLKSFKTDQVVIRFAFASDMGFCTEDDSTYNGLFLDDIMIADGQTVLFENNGEDITPFSLSIEGGNEISWLSIGNAAGRIGSGASRILDFDFSAGSLPIGHYSGVVHFITNDTLNTSLHLPVSLNVIEGNSWLDDAVTDKGASGYRLGRNYPNPFNNSTVINYQIPVQGNVSIEVFDMRGRWITTIFNGIRSAGIHEITWNGMNDSFQPVSSGVYFIRFKSNYVILTRKVLLLK